MKAEDWMLFALGVLVLTRKRVEWGDGWVWPLASVRVRGNLYRPAVTDGFTSRRGARLHAGLDIAFLRRNAGDLVDLFPPGTPGGGRSWFSPEHVPVLAARAGRVWSVEKQPRGWAVVLDHSKPFATFYTHLETPSLALHQKGVNVNTGQPTYVKAGDVLGFMGYDPTDPERVRHLHFAVWHEGTDDQSVDPSDAMKAWPYPPLVTTVA